MEGDSFGEPTGNFPQNDENKQSSRRGRKKDRSLRRGRSQNPASNRGFEGEGSTQEIKYLSPQPDDDRRHDWTPDRDKSPRAGKTGPTVHPSHRGTEYLRKLRAKRKARQREKIRDGAYEFGPRPDARLKGKDLNMGEDTAVDFGGQPGSGDLGLDGDGMGIVDPDDQGSGAFGSGGAGGSGNLGDGLDGDGMGSGDLGDQGDGGPPRDDGDGKKKKKKKKKRNKDMFLLPVSDMGPPVKKKRGKKPLNYDKKQKKADTDLLNSQTMDEDPETAGPPRDPYMCYRCGGKGKACPLCRNIGTQGAGPGIKYGIQSGGTAGGMGGDEAGDQDPNAIIEPLPDWHVEDMNLVGELSYRQVKRHQYKYHPRDRQRKAKFPFCRVDIKYLPFCCCYLCRCPCNQIKKTEWVTPCAKEIGLGPVLFLYTMRAFAWLFLILFILNLPLIFFYVKGLGPANEGRPSSGQFTDVFAMLSIGNIGTSDYSCANVNIAKNKKQLMFNCPYGTMRELTSFGLQRIDNQTCTKNGGTYIGEVDRFEDLQFDCNWNNGMTPEGKEAIMAEFMSKCFDQPTCNVDFLYAWFNQDCRNRINYYAAASKYSNYALDFKDWHFYMRDARIREPVLFGVAFCVSDKIFHPFTGEELSIDKSQFVYYILIIDIICVCIVIYFINWLEWSYKEYAKVFDDTNVEMRDFSLRIENIPMDMVYGGKELMLHAQLWNHIELLVQKAFEQNAERREDEAELAKIREDRHWEVIDLTFGKKDQRETELLVIMDQLDREKKTMIFQVQKWRNDKNPDQFAAQIEEQNGLIIEKLREYKEYKSEYINIQEDKLYEKWQPGFNGKTASMRSMLYAYVTFRSMRGKRKCEQTFSYVESFSKRNPEVEEEKKFFGNTLKFYNTCAPSSIKWEHIGYTRCNRGFRSALVWLFAILLVCIAFYLMVLFKNFNDELKAGASLDTKCPKDPIPADIALDDWEKPGKQRQGFMHCFCLRIYNEDGNVDSAMKLFQAEDPNVEKNYCEDWLWVFENNMYLTIISGAMVGALNGICVALFEHIVILEKLPTMMDEIKAQFSRIVMVQFLNIGCLLLFADFSIGYSQEEMGGLIILVGNYKDFDTNWYYDIGAKISMAMISNSIAPFFSKLFEPIIVPLLRCLDRCFEKHLLKRNNIKEKFKKWLARKKEEERVEREKQRKDRLAGGGAPAEDEEEEGEDESESEDQREGGLKNTKKNRMQKKEKKRQPVVEDSDEQYDGGDSRKKKTKKKSKKKAQPVAPDYQNDDIDDPFESVFQPDGGEDDDIVEPNVDGGDPQSKGGGTGGPPEDEKDPMPNINDAMVDEPETKQVFQDDLNEIYLNKLVAVFYIYAWFFTNYLIYLTFGGGMPLMYLLGFIHCVIGYWAYKWLFVDFYRKSYGFDEEIALWSIYGMKFGIFFHLLMNLFMYTDKRVLTPPVYNPEIHYRPPGEPVGQFFSRRFDSMANMSVMAWFWLCIIAYLVYRLICAPCKRICQERDKKRAARDFEDDSPMNHKGDMYKKAIANDFSDDIYKELKVHGIKNLYIRAHKDYELFRTMVNAISYDQELLTDEYAKHHKKKLKMRVQNLEDTIDVHLNSIGALERFMDRSYMYKIAVLEANEEKIQSKDDKVLRMVDITQSYYIYDAIGYQKENVTLQRIDKEMLELDYVEKATPVYC